MYSGLHWHATHASHSHSVEKASIGVEKGEDQRREEQRSAGSGTIRSEGSYSYLLKRFLAQALPIALLLMLYDDWQYWQDRQSRSSTEAMELYGFFVH